MTSPFDKPLDSQPQRAGHEPDVESDPYTDDDPLEAYCVRCRHMVEMLDPDPVWTARGAPGTRGTCPDCGGVIFRMGKTARHDALVRPPAVRIEGARIALGGGRKKAQPATYINYAAADSEFAALLADDLTKAGIHTWIDSGQTVGQDVKWAGGVHPALKEAARMVVVLSASSANDSEVVKAWQFFRQEKKPIALAVRGTLEVPDALRRSPRFNFDADYKTAFRQLLMALSD
jgi:hypothetical protein